MIKGTKYCEALRAIGQDLEAKHINFFDLTLSEACYSVRIKTETDAVARIFTQGLKQLQIQQNLSGEPGPVAAGQDDSLLPDSAKSRALSYEPELIERLETEGRAQRQGASTMPDFLSLSQILRAVGAMLDYKGARLISLSRPERLGAMQSVAVHYETSQGALQKEVHSFCNIYDFSVRMYKQRDLWGSQTIKAVSS